MRVQLLGLYPLPNTGGTGAGSLTNNYSREEQRTTDRDNYDVKVNFNRTSSNQIWGKFSMLDAVVDDLTYYLGPDTNSDQDGGFTKVYMFTGGQTWTLGPTLVWDMTVGFSRQDQNPLVRTSSPGNFGLDTLGIPGTNDQGTGDPRYAGYPQFATGFATLGNLDTWTPVWRDERVISIATNVTKIKGRHDLRAGYSMNFLFLNHWQPETGQPARAFRLLRQHDGAAGHGRADAELLQHLRFVPAGPRQQRPQERSERAADRPGMATRPVRPRPVAGHARG